MKIKIMLNKIKAFFSSNYAKVIGVLLLIISILAYTLNLKDKKIEAYKQQISLLTTVQASDVLEAKIRQDLSQISDNDSKVTQYNQLLKQLDEKRKQLSKNNSNPKQNENYWNQ